MRRLLVVLTALVVMLPASALAQDTLVIDINCVVGEHEKSFVYEPFVKDGKMFDADGIDLAFRVKLGNTATVGYRRERVGLSNAFNTLEGANYERRITKDIVFHDGSAKYRELYGSFKLPKTHGHALLVGVTKNNFTREWRGGSAKTSRKDSFAGLVLGGEGRQKAGKLSFDYSGRWYPRLNEKMTGKTTGGVRISDEEFRSSGYELRGTATWTVTKHFGLTGGYEFRRFLTDRTGSWLPTSEEQTSKGFLIGTRLSF